MSYLKGVFDFIIHGKLYNQDELYYIYRNIGSVIDKYKDNKLIMEIYGYLSQMSSNIINDELYKNIENKLKYNKNIYNEHTYKRQYALIEFKKQKYDFEFPIIEIRSDIPCVVTIPMPIQLKIFYNVWKEYPSAIINLHKTEYIKSVLIHAQKTLHNQKKIYMIPIAYTNKNTIYYVVMLDDVNYNDKKPFFIDYISTVRYHNESSWQEWLELNSHEDLISLQNVLETI